MDNQKRPQGKLQSDTEDRRMTLQDPSLNQLRRRDRLAPRPERRKRSAGTGESEERLYGEKPEASRARPAVQTVIRERKEAEPAAQMRKTESRKTDLTAWTVKSENKRAKRTVQNVKSEDHGTDPVIQTVKGEGQRGKPAARTVKREFPGTGLEERKIKTPLTRRHVPERQEAERKDRFVRISDVSEKEFGQSAGMRMLWGVLCILIVLLIAAIIYELILGHGLQKTGADRMNGGNVAVTETETETKTETGTETDPGTEAKTEAGTEAIAETGTKTEAGTEAIAETGTKTEAETETIADTGTEPIAEAGTETKDETGAFDESM